MTCIVGVKHDGNVYIGSDSRASNSFVHSNILGMSKIGIIEGSNQKIIYGISGKQRLTNVVKNKVTLPEKTSSMNDDNYIFEIVESIRKQAEKYNATITKDNKVDSESNWLLGYKGRLFIVQDDFSYFEWTEEYVTTGSGTYHADGYLYSKQHEDNPKLRIETAIKAAAYYVNGVDDNVHIVCLDGNENG